MTPTVGWTMAAAGVAIAGFPGWTAAQEGETYKRVEFVSTDGVTLVGDYFPPTGRVLAPPAILLHMYEHDRTSWTPLYEILHNGGFAVLAIDMRGHGESLKPEEMNLAQRVKDRDPKLFNDMYKDVEAAVKWVRGQPNVHQEKLALVGASVGCSVAIHYTSMHDGEVTAVVCLSPGTDYMGVDSLEHIAKIEKTPLLLMAGKSEREASEALVAKCKTAAYRAAGGQAHGTEMFGRAKKIDRRIAEYLFEKAFDRKPENSDE
jgi:pimeloyl-ACP methyl ester carboxylesterase